MGDDVCVGNDSRPNERNRTVATKTNINLTVNGIKVYTRKTTGRPYTHALVQHDESGWKIISCSSKGPNALVRWIEDANRNMTWYRVTAAAGPNEYHSIEAIDYYAKRIQSFEATRFHIVEIIDNTVAVEYDLLTSEVVKGGRA